MAKTLPAYFDRYGWQFERRRTDLYRTGFAGDTGQYEIWLRATDNWVYFTINPYIRAEGEPLPTPALRLLLELNYTVNLAKFLVDNDGDIALNVELPAEGFSYSHFADALTALSHYADEHRRAFDEAMGETGGEVV